MTVADTSSGALPFSPSLVLLTLSRSHSSSALTYLSRLAASCVRLFRFSRELGARSPSHPLPPPRFFAVDFFGNDSEQAQAAQAVQTQHQSSVCLGLPLRSSGATLPADPDFPHPPTQFTHELIAGAAAFEAQKAYARHCEQNGKPESHQKVC